MVTGIGLFQASVNGLSVAWVAHDAPGIATAPGPADPISLVVSVLVSTLLPFVAFAGDSTKLLRRHPPSGDVDWQVVGGLIGLCLALAAFHGVVTASMLKLAPSGFDFSLLYKLIIPAFVIGSGGAAIGSAISVLVRALRSVSGAGQNDKRP